MKSGPEQLRDWIGRAKLNQRDAADFFGFDESELSHILAGRRKLGLQRALKIEELSGIPVRAWASSERDESDGEVVTTARKRA